MGRTVEDRRGQTSGSRRVEASPGRGEKRAGSQGRREDMSRGSIFRGRVEERTKLQDGRARGINYEKKRYVGRGRGKSAKKSTLSKLFGDDSEEDVEDEKQNPPSSLKENESEEWIENEPMVPPGWCIKVKTFWPILQGYSTKRTRVLYRDRRNKIFQGRPAAVKHVTVESPHYTEEEVTFMKESEYKLTFAETKDWEEASDGFPSGWRKRTTKHKVAKSPLGYRLLTNYLSPENFSFKSKKSAIDYLVTKGCTQQQIGKICRLHIRNKPCNKRKGADEQKPTIKESNPKVQERGSA